MNHAKRLGIFAKTPNPGEVKTRLVPPLNADQSCALYRAFLSDLFARVYKMRGLRVTVFYAGDDPAPLKALLPTSWGLEPQKGDGLGNRLQAGFKRLLGKGGARAVIIGSDSPDIPVQTIRRAFQRLKHKDVALGPASDGGYYLVGLRANAPALFEGVDWGTDAVLAQTLERVERDEMSLSLMPVWYDVDTGASLDLLRSVVRARRLADAGRLRATEDALEAIFGPGG